MNTNFACYKIKDCFITIEYDNCDITAIKIEFEHNKNEFTAEKNECEHNKSEITAIKNEFEHNKSEITAEKNEFAESHSRAELEKPNRNTKFIFGCPTELSDMVSVQLTEYFDGKRKTFDFPYRLIGTEFQQQVWKELCNIPYGQTSSYDDVARAVKRDKACRAVGSANKANPMLIVIPCHRVIAKNGNLSGYAGGIKMKKFLLELEKKFS